APRPGAPAAGRWPARRARAAARTSRSRRTPSRGRHSAAGRQSRSPPTAGPAGGQSGATRLAGASSASRTATNARPATSTGRGTVVISADSATGVHCLSTAPRLRFRWLIPIPASDVQLGRQRGGGRRHLEPVGAHPVLDRRDHGLDHLDPGPPLAVAFDQRPRRVRRVGAVEHVLDRVLVLLALVPIAPVLVGELPLLERVGPPPLEPLELLLFGQVQPELDQDRAVVHQRPLELADLLVGPAPLVLGGEALDPLDQDPAVPGPVEHGHAAPARQLRPEPPEIVVP